jgi:multiple sugar transport system substrate-binding protein
MHWQRETRRDQGGKMRRLAATLSVLFLVGAACTAGAPEPAGGSGGDGSREPVTISIWGAWTGRELKQFNKIFAPFEKQYPWITVKSSGGIEDPKILAAIRSGSPPDVVLSFGLDSVGAFCSTGAWQNLTPYIEGDNLDLSQFPESVFQYTSFAGKQCAFPFLTDAYGLYYNKEMFAKAGLQKPPRTFSELTQYAKKLTQFNPDGSIKVAGYVPWIGYYSGGAVPPMSTNFGVEWYDDSGQSSAVATDPAWQEYLTWQKELVDWYGAEKLQEFVAGAGNEWGAGHDFHHGRIAMMLDGEWRTAFLADLKPDLKYATAPFVVPDDQLDSYGMGQIGGTIIGMPRGSAHPDEAWLLLKFMATDTDTLVYMANNVRNVPTTFAALEAPELDVTPQFKTFLEIFEDPGSHYKETSAIGVADQNILSDFGQKWQIGKASDLQAGLEQAAQQIDAQLQQSAAP